MTTRPFSLVSLSVLLALATPARAQLACGDVVGKGEKITLTADLGPCDGDPGNTAAIIVDGGTLDLGGHTVTCADLDTNGETAQGIGMLGKKSKVMNGTIVGCQNGVFLADDGKHLVQGITARASRDDGLDTEGSAGKNKIFDNTFVENANDGISINSSKNKIARNIASQNVEDGIDIREGDKNVLNENTTTENGDDGIEVGGQKNKLIACTASNNTEDGIDFGNSKNLVRGGTAQGNGVYDINDCSGNKVKKLSFTTGSADCQ